MNGTKITMNPIWQVQKEIADMLRADEWMKAHRVTIIEQDAQGLRFLLEKSVGQIKGVVLVVGCDKFTNDFPRLKSLPLSPALRMCLRTELAPIRQRRWMRCRRLLRLLMANGGILTSANIAHPKQAFCKRRRSSVAW